MTHFFHSLFSGGKQTQAVAARTLLEAGSRPLAPHQRCHVNQQGCDTQQQSQALLKKHVTHACSAISTIQYPGQNSTENFWLMMSCKLSIACSTTMSFMLTRLSDNDVGHTPVQWEMLTHIWAKTLLRRKPKWSWERGLNSGRPSVLELLLHPINSSSNWTKTSQIRNQNVKKKESKDVSVCVTTWRVRWHSETIHCCLCHIMKSPLTLWNNTLIQSQCLSKLLPYISFFHLMFESSHCIL